MFKKSLSVLLAALFLLLPLQALGAAQEDWDAGCRYKTSRETFVYDRSMYGSAFTFSWKDTLPAGTYINVINVETDGRIMVLYCKNGQETLGWIDSDAYEQALRTVLLPDGTSFGLPEAAWGNENAVRRFMAQYYTQDQIDHVVRQMYTENASSSPAAETWTCFLCGATGNTGLFCPRCGAPKNLFVQTGTPVPSPSVAAGDLLLIGTYGGQDLLWQVLALQNGQALLLSRYGIERSCFNTNCAGQTWADSTVRKWLNDRFYPQAFSSAESAAILVSYVNEAEDQASKAFPPKRIGQSTNDHLFLLSYAELMDYVPSMRDRQCVPTAHALQEGSNYSDTVYLDGQPTCWWWLRSPAYRNNALVVNQSGEVEACMISQTYGVVRPAMWVDLDVLQQNGELSFGTASAGVSYIPSGTSNPNSRIATQNTPTPSPVPLPQTASPSVSWQNACRNCIQDARYRTASGSSAYPSLSGKETVAFALHDMDSDGIPELLIHNGKTGTPEAAVWAYAFSGSGYRWLGLSGRGDCRLFYYPERPGVVCSTTSDGVVSLDHYTAVNGNLIETRVLETVYTDASYSAVNTTWQDPAFFDGLTSGGSFIDFWDLETIQSFGWDAFLEMWK